MRRLLAAAALLASCSKPTVQGAGILAEVSVDPSVKADCVSVIATAGDGTSKESDRAPRKASLTFGIAEGNGITGTIHLVARGYLGDCSATPALNAESTAITSTFVEGRTDTVAQLMLTGALDDSDHDGFRAVSAGGTDCDDTSASVNPGAAEQCNDGVDNDCNAKIDCADSPACDGASCDDGQSCSTNDSCSGGQCIGVSAQCNTSPGGCFHLPGQCLMDGGCVYAVDVGTACDGGVCASNGACVSVGSEVLCSDGLDNDNDGKTDCADSDCLGQACSDSDLCTTNDTCQANGTCAGAAKDCGTPPGQCFDAGTCLSATGACLYPIAEGHSCDDSNVCTSLDKCGADAGCAGAPKACNTPPNTCFVRQGSCDQGTGSCVYVPDAGAVCNDQDPCTFTDVCSLAGSCVGTSYNCNAPPPCFGSGVCRGDGGCTYAPLTGGTCNSGAGFCVAGVCQTQKQFGYMPSNFVPPDAGWSAPVHITGTCVADFNTSSGAWSQSCSQVMPVAQMVTLTDGKTAALLPFSGLIIDAAAGLRLHGNNPVILAVLGDATISGNIDGSSTRTGQGPGGGYFVCGPPPDGNGNVGVAGGNGRGSGAGGGGFGSAGSNGAGVPSSGGGAGGIVNGDGGLVPLRGGCNGEHGGSNDNTAGAAGMGGGGVQISVSGTLSIPGSVAASGAGGQAGQDHSSGGGGAGSGGGLLLEADTLTLGLVSVIATNGGGGGEGASNNGATQNGANGATTTVFAAAGGQLSFSGGDGASGAAGIPGGVFAAAGSAGMGTEGGGGGGGGVGQIVFRGVTACTVAGFQSGRITKQGTCQ